MSDEVIYTSKVRVEKIRGPLRRTYLPAEEQPIYFSTHSEVAAYYKHDPSVIEERATTLDYVVAATAG
ncbi:MAG: hypothetical protein JSV68_03475 [Anaerolineaceae bacterium]|jgi:nitrous oxide reductase accessory protein NosL|nr:hypothetical protein [Chloroflexota bacterium]UCC53023.1 MAG: hypothetical protein JSV68_03475 [Anaerolineaceae bacterium]